MEPVDDDNKNNSCCESTFFREDEKVEAMNLLEECWFFENMLNITRPKMMPRCHSDPYPSSSTGLINRDFLVKDNNDKPPSKNGDFVHTKKIQRAPSMPPLRDREEGGSSSTKSKLVKGNQNHHRSESSSIGSSRRKSKLLRTPSLPPSVGRDEKFKESDHQRSGRSHKQQSSPNHVDILPPRQTSKSCSIPRYRPTRNNNIEVVENTSREGIKEMRRRYLNQKTMRRSLSDLELEEVQGFKDLGFSFEKEALSPSLASIIPGLQEKSYREETEEDKKARGPYLSEAWLVQSCLVPPPPPIIPNWAPKKSSVSDMKEQIKFWARAVASNVHQEC